MAALSSLDRDPALPTDPVAPPRGKGHPHLPSGGCNGLASAPSPQPTPGAAAPTSTTPDPAANCGMPDRPLHATATTSPLPRTCSGSSEPGAGSGVRTPLPDRCWDLFCQGHSYAAIGRTLGIHRETAARHVHALHQQVQADRRADRALALSRALATQQRLQATAWDLLARATGAFSPRPVGDRSGERSASGSPLPVGEGLGVRSSLADCARLLNLILTSAREAARLELLYDKDAPARQADADEQPKTVHLIIERVGDPYVDPTQPPAAPSSPPTTAGANASRPSPVPIGPASDPAAGSDPSDSPLGAGGSPPPSSSSSPDSSAPLSGFPAESNSASLPLPPDRPVAFPAESSSVACAIAPSPSPAPAPTVPVATPPPRSPVSLGDGSAVWPAGSPLPTGEGSGVRSGSPPRDAALRGGAGGEVRPRPRRIRFGLPVAAGYPLG